jgi:hypothetical protein
MTAPESKWVAEAMRLAEEFASFYGIVSTAPRADLLAHLQRQADLMERMGEALELVLTERSIVNWHDEPKIRAALTAFQESKQ